MSLLAQFIYLQLLDVLTTVAFMLSGVGEYNPLVRWAIREGPHPIGSLLAIKAVAVSLAILCLYRHREHLLRTANIFFACLVAYNLVALILSHPAIH